MDGRKQKVLGLIVDDYIATAEPVGSRTLARKYALGISPATIRNEMADLEELGYLEQPHTSAGRIPSDKGYRYYVDRLMKPSTLDRALLEVIKTSYRARIHEVQWFIHQTAKLVSAMTAYPSLVLAPPMMSVGFWDLSVVPIGANTALMVIRTDAGTIENRTVSVPEELNMQDIQAMAEELSQEFRGTPIRELERAWQRLSGDLKRHQQFWEDFLQWTTADPDDEDKMTLRGALNILNYPEFRDVEKVRRVLGFLETEAAVDRVLTARSQQEGIEVLIGAEISSNEIQDCSVVTTTYQVGHRVVGRLLVLGPRRMQYARVISILEAVSEELSRALNWA